MSQAVTQGRRPRPESARKAPIFTGSRLPKSLQKVAKNLLLQQRDEREFQSRSALTACENGEAASTELCCKSLHISLFFDGTNNNELADSRSTPRNTSNIARLYYATIDQNRVGEKEKPAIKPSFYNYSRYYCPGVGTTFPAIGEHYPLSDGLIGAEGGENRINWALTRLLDAVSFALNGSGLALARTQELVREMSTGKFSEALFNTGPCNRENAMRPEMETLEQQLNQRKQAKQKPEILAVRLYVYGFSRGAAQARTFCNWLQKLVTNTELSGATNYRFAGLPISIQFLGLFDTVAAVGLADSVPFAAGHMSWADGTMRLPDDDTRLPEDQRFLERCVHLTSAHEQRASFPLDSIRRCDRLADGSINKNGASRYRANTEEFMYPGMHSDVGGGYPPGDQGKAPAEQGLLMSQIPLHHMYAEAFEAGAPLTVPEQFLCEDLLKREPWRSMPGKSAEDFAVSPELIERFNAWQKQVSSGPLEEVMERETELLTGWRIDRYHGGVSKTSFYSRTGKDETAEVREAKERLHKHKHQELEEQRNRLKQGKTPLTTCEIHLAGKPDSAHDTCPGYSAWLATNLLNPLEPYRFDSDLQTIGGLTEYQAINIEKLYEPTMDQRQLQGAAAEFSRDYRGDWGPTKDEIGGGVIQSIVATLTTALSGTVYLINEEDEAKQYASIHTNGTAQCHKLFSAPRQITPGQEALVALFDDHVHDSRAWFMNSSSAGPRETWTDYFRYRLVHFDHETNKSMTPLLTATRVVGLAIAVGSVGLAVKRRDPRYLLGLILPTLAVPVIRGKLPMLDTTSLLSVPQISAFDPLTGLAYPMMSGIDNLRAYTREPGSLVQMIDAMPAPQPLTELTATTPELKSILQAAQAAKAVAEAKEGNPMGLIDMVVDQVSEAGRPETAQSSDWLDMAGDMVGKKLGIG